VCNKKWPLEPNADVGVKPYTTLCADGWNRMVELCVATSQKGFMPIPKTPENSSPALLTVVNGTKWRGIVDDAACTGSARLSFLTNLMGSTAFVLDEVEIWIASYTTTRFAFVRIYTLSQLPTILSPPGSVRTARWGRHTPSPIGAMTSFVISALGSESAVTSRT